LTASAAVVGEPLRRHEHNPTGRGSAQARRPGAPHRHKKAPSGSQRNPYGTAESPHAQMSPTSPSVGTAFAAKVPDAASIIATPLSRGHRQEDGNGTMTRTPPS
jgi:hypothetical protein